MPSRQLLDRLLTAYAQAEPWKRDHDEAMAIFRLEELLAKGIDLFQKLARVDAEVEDLASEVGALIAEDPDAEKERRDLDVENQKWRSGMMSSYQQWVLVSERILAVVAEMVARGYSLRGLEEFRLTLEEARCLLASGAIEAEMRPTDDIERLVKQSNPRPERYDD